MNQLSFLIVLLCCTSHLFAQNLTLTNPATGKEKTFKPGDKIMVRSLRTIDCMAGVDTVTEMAKGRFRGYENGQIKVSASMVRQYNGDKRFPFTASRGILLKKHRFDYTVAAEHVIDVRKGKDLYGRKSLVASIYAILAADVAGDRYQIEDPEEKESYFFLSATSAAISTTLFLTNLSRRYRIKGKHAKGVWVLKQ